jgi:hypothetical protein
MDGLACLNIVGLAAVILLAAVGALLELWPAALTTSPPACHKVRKRTCFSHCFRSMDSLACLNVIGLAAVILLAAVAALLGVAAVASGTAHAIPMMPQWQLLGPTKALQLEAMAGVLPVILASYVVHQVG